MATPSVNVYAADLPRAVAFYEGLGFRETFRTPAEGPPVHVELTHEGFTLGVVDGREPTRGFGWDAEMPGRGTELVWWTDDADATWAGLVAAGGRPLREVHDFLTHLRRGWVADLDGNPIQVVMRR